MTLHAPCAGMQGVQVCPELIQSQGDDIL